MKMKNIYLSEDERTTYEAVLFYRNPHIEFKEMQEKSEEEILEL